MLEGLLIVLVAAAGAALLLAGKVRAQRRALDRAERGLVDKESLAQLGLLMAGIAHELNTPVGAIACSLDTRRRALARMREEVAALRRGDDPDGTDARLERLDRALAVLADGEQVLETAVARATAIVRHMRLTARGEADTREDVDLDEVVRGALVLLHNRLKQGVEVRHDAGGDVRVRGNGAGLASIAINLLANARQAVGERGRITVATRREGGRAVLRVEDDGPGVPLEDCERIFAPGYTTKDREEGTGLGLTISRRIAENHGGTLTATAGPEGGAVFTLDLPAAPAGGPDAGCAG